ncbi:hypothetical protein [Actinomadura flavalba]|uniref:hypothetical protein n=1 Tax=Actinomadura flavalba TaxID=1120938 RepID=UPI00039F45ED|nr:hypothetical protein [Actinomadura flavalba]
MGRELVVVTRERPDVASPYLTDAADRLLAHVRAPLLVEVPGETERLLGVRVDEPVWWVEIRAAADPPAAGRAAWRYAEDLAARHDGTVWFGART